MKGARTSPAYVARIVNRMQAGDAVRTMFRDLSAKGYSWVEIAKAVDLAPSTVRDIASKGLVGVATAARIAAWYDAGCAGLPDTPARPPEVTAWLRQCALHARKWVRKDTP